MKVLVSCPTPHKVILEFEGVGATEVDPHLSVYEGLHAIKDALGELFERAAKLSAPAPEPAKLAAVPPPPAPEATKPPIDSLPPTAVALPPPPKTPSVKPKPDPKGAA